MQQQQERAISAKPPRSRLEVALSWLLVYSGAAILIIWALGFVRARHWDPLEIAQNVLFALQAALGLLGGGFGVLRLRALARRALSMAAGVAVLTAVTMLLLGWRFYQRGELFPITLLILAGMVLAFLALGALLYFIGRWLGVQEDA